MAEPHWVPPPQPASCLFASFTPGLAFQSSFLRKQRFCCHALPLHTHTQTHTRVCVAAAFLINFDHISIPADRGAVICKHA